MSNTKVKLSFAEISARLHALELPVADAVVGILTGGRVPGALLAHQLHLPLYYITLNYRAPDNTPRYEAPRLEAPPPTLPAGARLLLVDDVAVSGKTLASAREFFCTCAVTTVVLKGRADRVCFPEIQPCVQWPW